jgi:hypothetical protein
VAISTTKNIEYKNDDTFIISISLKNTQSISKEIVVFIIKRNAIFANSFIVFTAGNSFIEKSDLKKEIRGS